MAKIDLHFSGSILISHTGSKKQLNDQTARLARHLKKRGHKFEDFKVENLGVGKTNKERRAKITEWLAKNPDGALYRNKMLLPVTPKAAPKPAAKKAAAKSSK